MEGSLGFKPFLLLGRLFLSAVRGEWGEYVCILGQENPRKMRRKPSDRNPTEGLARKFPESA